MKIRMSPSEFKRMRKPSKAPRNKYGVAPKDQRTWNGVLYASKREMVEAQSLHARMKRGEIRDWMRQVSYDLTANITIGIFRSEPVVIGRHVVDFLVVHLDDSREVIEVKGHETDLWKWKRKHFEAQYPHIKYTVVK